MATNKQEHDYFLDAEIKNKINLGLANAEHSLFIKEISNSNNFEKNKLYIGSRITELTDYNEIEESIILYVTDVDDNYVHCFYVAYEIRFNKDGKTKYISDKYEGPYSSRLLSIDKSTNNVYVKLGLYSDPDLGFDDDTKIAVSPKAKASLRGWWLDTKSDFEF